MYRVRTAYLISGLGIAAAGSGADVTMPATRACGLVTYPSPSHYMPPGSIHVHATDGSRPRVVPYKRTSESQFASCEPLPILSQCFEGKSWCRGPGSSGSASAKLSSCEAELPALVTIAAGKGTPAEGSASDSGARNLRLVACMRRRARRHAPRGRVVAPML